jgi:hypothetical protein
MKVAAAALVLLPAALALVIPRQDKHISDFRGYTEVDCPYQSGGIFTITQTTLGCHPFSQYYPAPLQAKGVIGVNVNEGCTMNVYTDDTCTEGETPMAVGKCLSRPQGWGSFKVSCQEPAQEQEAAEEEAPKEEKEEPAE